MASHASGQRPPGAVALVAIFVVVIALPGLGLAAGFGRTTISEPEMRILAEWPRWSWQLDALGSWPRRFQQYFDDHFALRAELIRWRTQLFWKSFRMSAFDAAIAGKNEWLFLADDGALRDWVQEEPFSHRELADWREVLIKRKAYLARRGIPYLFVLAPDKHMIYPEHMPDTIRRQRDDFRADQLIAYMRRTTPDFEILDLREALLAAKSRQGEPLYHRNDTHWNDRGALVAYQAIAQSLRRWFPNLTPLTRADFTTDPSVPSGDKTSLLGLADDGKRSMPGLVLTRGAGYRIVAPARPDPYGEDPILIVEHRDQSLPTAIVMRDSFGARLIPLLSEHFRRVEYYWLDELAFEEIERLKPDIVIQEFVARHFFTYGPYAPDIPE